MANNTQYFLASRMVGERFDDHAIPLELLKDLAVLEELMVGLAKDCYLGAHQNRQRTPKGFTGRVSLKLADIKPGSAIAGFVLEDDKADLFPTGITQYFEQARARFFAAINAAEKGDNITPHIRQELLGYFDRLGRSLRTDEAFEFSSSAGNGEARLDRETRRRLQQASGQDELTDEVVLRGLVPEADQAKWTFVIQKVDGMRVKAPIESQYMHTVKEAFNGFAAGTRVVLHGIGRFSRGEQLKQIEAVERMELLADLDVPYRIEELKLLRHGWLDGDKGIAPTHDALNWLAEAFQRYYPDDDLPLPCLYPTAEGQVQMEWSIGQRELSLEIDLQHRRGDWHALDLNTQQEDEAVFQLDERFGWNELLNRLRTEKVSGENGGSDAGQ